MAIQFLCSGCGQPIEVDDEYAGQTAACPYCRQIVTVPPESTYRPEAVASARPAPSPSGTPAPEAPLAGLPPQAPVPVSGPSSPEQAARLRTARKLGIAALVVLGVATVLLGISVVYSMMYSMQALAGADTQPVSPGELQQLQRESMQAMYAEIQEKPWLLAVNCGFPVFVVLGFFLSLFSVGQSRRGNWPGIVALVVSIGFGLLMCLGIVIQMQMGGVPV